MRSDVPEEREALDRLERYTQRIAEYVEAMGGVQRLEQLPVRELLAWGGAIAEELNRMAEDE